MQIEIQTYSSRLQYLFILLTAILGVLMELLWLLQSAMLRLPKIEPLTALQKAFDLLRNKCLIFYVVYFVKHII